MSDADKYAELEQRVASLERACLDLAASVRDLAAHATHINEVTAASIKYGEAKRQQLGDAIRHPKGQS